MTYGSKVWIFPDAELPPEGVNSIPGHESIIITNARIEIYLTFNPDNFAASLFPPTAKKLLPVAVWAVKKYKMTATISIRITAIGIPAIFPKASFPNVSDKPEIGNPSE